MDIFIVIVLVILIPIIHLMENYQMDYYDNKNIMLKNECASLQNSEELMNENDVLKENMHELKCQALQ